MVYLHGFSEKEMNAVPPQSVPLPAAQKQICRILYPPAYVANNSIDIAIHGNNGAVKKQP